MATRKAKPAETGECSDGCSGQTCRSCSAAMLADCVALCCCPLAVVSLLGLALIKVPCAVGKKCWGRRKSKEKVNVCGNNVSVSVSRKESVGEKGRIGETVEQGSLCGEVIEGDNVLLEMYQVGHMGFGRVSFTGTHPSDKDE